MATVITPDALYWEFFRVRTILALERKLGEILKMPEFRSAKWATEGANRFLLPAIAALKKQLPSKKQKFYPSPYVKVHRNSLKHGLRIDGEPDKCLYAVMIQLDGLAYPIADGCNLLVQIVRRALGARDVNTSRAALLIAYSWSSLLYHPGALPVVWSAACVEGDITVADCKARLKPNAQTVPSNAPNASPTQTPTATTRPPVAPGTAKATSTVPKLFTLKGIFPRPGRTATIPTQTTQTDPHAFIEGLCGASSPGSWDHDESEKLAFQQSHFNQCKELLGPKGRELGELQRKARVKGMLFNKLLGPDGDIGGCGEILGEMWMAHLLKYLRTHPTGDLDPATVRFVTIDKQGIEPVIEELRLRSTLQPPRNLVVELDQIMTTETGRPLFVPPCWRCQLFGVFICDELAALGIPLTITHETADGPKPFTTWTLESVTSNLNNS